MLLAAVGLYCTQVASYASRRASSQWASATPSGRLWQPVRILRGSLEEKTPALEKVLLISRELPSRTELIASAVFHAIWRPSGKRVFVESGTRRERNCTSKTRLCCRASQAQPNRKPELGSRHCDPSPPVHCGVHESRKRPQTRARAQGPSSQWPPQAF